MSRGRGQVVCCRLAESRQGYAELGWFKIDAVACWRLGELASLWLVLFVCLMVIIAPMAVVLLLSLMVVVVVAVAVVRPMVGCGCELVDVVNGVWCLVERGHLSSGGQNGQLLAAERFQRQFWPARQIPRVHLFVVGWP